MEKALVLYHKQRPVCYNEAVRCHGIAAAGGELV
jgi:hypothetical protein